MAMTPRTKPNSVRAVVAVVAVVAVKVNRIADGPATDQAIDSVTIAVKEMATDSVTAAAETIATIAATAETASPRVTKQPTRSSRLPMPAQRTLAVIKTASSPSARGADVGVAVVSGTMTGRPTTRWKVRPRSTQTARQPKRSQNPLASHIDDDLLTSATRDGAEGNVRPWNQR